MKTQKRFHCAWAVLLLGVFLLSTRPVSADLTTIAITESHFLTAESGFYQDAIQRVLVSNNSPLASYSETVGGQSMAASQSIWAASQGMDFSLNPKVLLATLYVEGKMSQAPADGFTLSMQAMFRTLWQGYAAYTGGARTVTLANGQSVRVSEDVNAPTYALAVYFAPSMASENDLKARLVQWSEGYLRLFGTDPRVDLMRIMADTTLPLPFLQLPFAQPAENFLKVNSFLDHARPGIYDDSIVRFDGKNIGSATFSGCTLGVSCYGGHNGIDYKTGAGMPILAAASGTVVYKYFNTNPDEGAVDSGLIIDHGNGYKTAYWHMDPIQVNQGDVVMQGQQIGLSGNIGMSSGPHLHFGLRRVQDNKSVDPYGWWSTALSDPWGDSTWMWAGDMIADDREPQSQFFYNSYWYYDSNGYQNGSFWSYSVAEASRSTNWGMWGTYIPADGNYDVYAYWPKRSDNTTRATYTIFHNGTTSTVTANQSLVGDAFVLLGTFYFNQGPAVVMLSDFTGESGKRVYFDAIRWGSSGSVSTPSAPPVGAGVYDDSAAQIAYTGNWLTWTGSGAYNNNLHYSSSIGNRASLTFNGVQASLYYTGYEYRGVMNVYIDGTLVASINQYDPILTWQKRWDSPVLTDGVHTITVEHASGIYVDLDAIQVYATALPTPTPTATETLTPTQTFTPVSSANALQPGQTYDDTNPFIQYEAGWYRRSKVGAYNDTITYSTVIGSSGSFTFVGTKVSILYTAAYTRGVAEIYIDGVKVAAINQYDPGQVFQKRWDSANLAYGTHTFSIKHISGSYVELDAVMVASSVTPTSAVLSSTPTPTSTMTPTQTQTSPSAPATSTPTPTQTNTLTQNALQPGQTYDDTNPFIQYEAGWYRRSKVGAYNDTITYSTVIGSSGNFTFVGTKVSILYTAAYTRGVAEIYIDGVKVAAINQYDPGQVFQKRWDSANLAYGTHTFSIKHISGSYVELDAVMVASSVTPTSGSTLTPTRTTTSGVTPTPTLTQTSGVTLTPTLTQTGTLTSTQTPTVTFTAVPTMTATTTMTSTSTMTIAPGSLQSGQTYDDTNPLIQYGSGWYSRAKTGAYNNTITYSTIIGSSGSFNFTGTNVSILYTATYTRGVAEIYIDGVKVALVNQYDPGQVFQKRWDSAALPYGTHTFSIKHISGSYIELDAVIVSGAAPVMDYRYQPGTPVYLPNFAHLEYGSNWMGVAGQVFDLQGNPLSNLVVVVSGSLNGVSIDSVTLTGLATLYGPGGYEIELARSPADSSGTLRVSLYNLNGVLLAGPLPFNTFADPEKNLILINFVQAAVP